MIVQMIRNLRRQNNSRLLNCNPDDWIESKLIPGILLALMLALLFHLAIILLILLTGCEVQCSPRLNLHQNATISPKASMIDNAGFQCEKQL